MTDFTLVDPKGWEYDLHSVYSAYIEYFQVHNIPWFGRTWGHLFTSFEDFLAFSWPTITVTDAHTGRAHIVTRLNSISAFLKMIKTRFGETLPQAPNILLVTPFEVSSRHLRNISDYSTYKKLYSTLPAAVSSAQRVRVRVGDSQTIRELWSKRDKTFLALSFMWSERNEKSCLEFGYAAVRCGNVETSGLWPPIPDKNYRKGHYIVEEYVDKVTNKYPPNQPWQFGESQLTPKAKLPQIIQAVISSLMSPESETSSNTIVLIGYGPHAQLARLEEMKIKLPHNVLVIDIPTFERALHATGERGVIPDSKTERPRTSSSTLNLEGLLRSLQHPQFYHTSVSKNSSNSGNSPPSSTGPRLPPPFVIPQLTNSGNEAFMTLFALQMLLDPVGVRSPAIEKGTSGSQAQGQVSTMANMNTMQAMNMMGPMAMGIVMPGMPPQSMSSMPLYGVSAMPMVVVNGAMGPMAPSASQQLTPINKNSSQRVKANSGSRKVQRAASAFDLGGEFNHLQESMKSSGPITTSNSIPLLLAPAGQQQKEGEKSITGTGTGSLWDRKLSLLGLERRHRRNTGYSSLLR